MTRLLVFLAILDQHAILVGGVYGVVTGCISLLELPSEGLCVDPLSHEAGDLLFRSAHHGSISLSHTRTRRHAARRRSCRCHGTRDASSTLCRLECVGGQQCLLGSERRFRHIAVSWAAVRQARSLLASMHLMGVETKVQGVGCEINLRSRWILGDGRAARQRKSIGVAEMVTLTRYPVESRRRRFAH
jgi:hypothetical protein